MLGGGCGAFGTEREAQRAIYTAQPPCTAIRRITCIVAVRVAVSGSRVPVLTFKLSISRKTRSAAVAVLIGVMMALVTLMAPQIETVLRRCRPQDGIIGRVYGNLDLLVYDSLFRARDSETPFIEGRNPELNASIKQVVIVAIRDNDLSRNSYMRSVLHSPYPFKRSVHAFLLRKLKAAGAVVVGMDIDFTDESAYGKEDDREFAAAMQECGNVVLAAKTPTSTTSGSLAAFEATSLDFPFSSLRQAARYSAPADIPTDSDGAVRRFHLFAVHPDPDLPLGDKDFLRFAPAIAAVYSHDTQVGHAARAPIGQEVLEQETAKQIREGRFLGAAIKYHHFDLQSFDEVVRIDPGIIGTQAEAWRRLTPLEQDAAVRFRDRNEDLSIPICFAGYQGDSSCRIIDYQDVLVPENSANLEKWFKDKIVLVGSMIQEEHSDAQSSPLTRGGGLANKRFGVEVHANIIHTLISRHFYQDFDESRRVALVWAFGLITALLVAVLRPVLALIPIAVLLVMLVWLVNFSFAHYVFMKPVQIGVVTGLAYGLESVYFYFVENRHVRRARARFQRYVGPDVMKKVLDTDFRIGTVEKLPATVMFTDLQGFTTLSETMTPLEAVTMLNSYTDDMLVLIRKYSGTLDKIMGDGLMAYFNAPWPVDRHAQKAVECALDMQGRMREWRKVSEEKGVPPLKVRIGIHTGEVVVGDVGAREQVGFTVIGDVVNTAARLEPLNKEFGTEILISEAVNDQLDGTIETVCVGELAIRGRKEGIRAYSVTGRKPISQPT